MTFPEYAEAKKKIQAAVRITCPRKDKFGYLDGYEALIELFKGLDFCKHTHVQAGAYAIYGWMPRTLKYSEENHRARYDALGKFASKLSEVSVVAALEFYSNNAIIQKSINNSVVGTSKFLHFVAPKVFPIWDSKIAKHFSCKPESASDYAKYSQALQDYLNNVNPTFDNLPPQLMKKNVSDLRRLEFCIFNAAH